jgi:hypothetical protein
MAQHQDLCFERGSRSEESDQPTPDQPAELVHRAEDSADSLPEANRQGQLGGRRSLAQSHLFDQASAEQRMACGIAVMKSFMAFAIVMLAT